VESERMIEEVQKNLKSGLKHNCKSFIVHLMSFEKSRLMLIIQKKMKRRFSGMPSRKVMLIAVLVTL